MMAWQLNNDVSYCRLDGQLVFLDIDKDRYFQLSETLERRFLDFASGTDMSDTHLSPLVKHNILSPHTRSCDQTLSAAVPPLPSRSALETSGVTTSLSAPVVLDVFVSVVAMRWRLKRRRLKHVLEGLTHYRREHIAALGPTRDQPDTERRVVEAAVAFNRIRPYVPVTSRCLVDSLSLVAFLARHGLPASLVIAVACDPFSAHAWVQYGGIVLNDTVGNACNHVPMRVL